MDEAPGYWATTLAFFGGIALIIIIEQFIPNIENPHKMKKVENMNIKKLKENQKLMYMELFTCCYLFNLQYKL